MMQDIIRGRRMGIMMVSTSLRLKERFLGTIFGQAVGDALGLSTEFMSKQEVDRSYPNGIEDYSPLAWT